MTTDGDGRAFTLTKRLRNCFRANLNKTFESDTWNETIATFSANYQKERKRIETQLVALEHFMEAQIASLDVITDAQMIKGVEQRYTNSQTEHKRLEAE